MPESASVVSIVPEPDDTWATFDNLWLIYPRRVARKDALRAWDKLTTTQQETALTVLPIWVRVWAPREMERIPHPATWLNGWRFDDELPPEFQKSVQRVNDNAEFKDKMDRALVERRPMPEALRALLSAMKKRI